MTVELFKGDCLEFMKGLKSESVDLVVTSPPYNIGTGRGPSWDNVEWCEDTMPEEEYQAWQVNVLNEAYRIVKSTGSIFYNHKIRRRECKAIHPMTWLQKTEWILMSQIIWDRGSTHNHQKSKTFWNVDELIFWMAKDSPYFDERFAKLSTVWRFSFGVNSKHPAPFPETLPLRCINATTKKGDIVLDPFFGSGTVAIAALNLERNFIGCEISEPYFNIAKKRIEDAQLQYRMEI